MNINPALGVFLSIVADRVALSPAERAMVQPLIDQLNSTNPVEVKISKADLKNVVSDMLASEVKRQLPELGEIETLIKTAVVGAVAEYMANEHSNKEAKVN